MLRSILRGTVSKGPKVQAWNLLTTFNYATKNTGTKATVNKAKKTKSKSDASADDTMAANDVDAALFDDNARARRLALDENNPSLDVGPNDRPLFTSTPSLSQLTGNDACSYLKFKYAM